MSRTFSYLGLATLLDINKNVLLVRLFVQLISIKLEIYYYNIV